MIDEVDFIDLNKENICIKYPLFLANSFRKIISSDKDEVKIKNSINLIELLFHHLFNICAPIYISLIKEEKISENISINKKIIEKIYKISFGDYLYLLPELLTECSNEINKLNNISNLIKNNSNKINQIINIRNDITEK